MKWVSLAEYLAPLGVVFAIMSAQSAQAQWKGVWNHIHGPVKVGPSCAQDHVQNIQYCFSHNDHVVMIERSRFGEKDWRQPKSLGGIATSEPSCAVSPEQGGAIGSVICAVRGTDNAMYVKIVSGVQDDTWRHLGGELTSAPRCYDLGTRRFICYARGADNILRHRTLDGSSNIRGEWTPWVSLSGAKGLPGGSNGIPVAGPPECVAAQSQTLGSRSLSCFVQGHDSLFHFMANNTGSSINGDFRTSHGAYRRIASNLSTTPASPSCIALSGTRTDCYVRAADNSVTQVYMENNIQQVFPQGGAITAPPVVVGDAHSRQIFVRGTNGSLWVKDWRGGWSGWKDLGGGLREGAPISCLKRNDSSVDCVVVGTDNHLHQFQATYGL